MTDRVHSNLHRKGEAFFSEQDWLGALACYAEIVRLNPGDFQARLRASTSLLKLGERERAITAYHAAAESLLTKGFLLSAMVACKEALSINPLEKRVRDTLLRIHGRATKEAAARAKVPPPLPPEPLAEEPNLWSALVGLSGSELVEKAMSVLATYVEDPEASKQEGTPLPLFAELDRDAFVEVVERMEIVEKDKGDLLIREGMIEDVVYVICAGGAEVVRGVDGPSPLLLAKIGPGSLFGEMSLLTDAPRSATVRMDRPSELFVLNRRIIKDISARYKSVPQQLVSFCRKRLLANLVRTSPLFRPFETDDRRALLRRFVSKVYQPGNTIIEEGRDGEGLFVVLTGEVQVTKKNAVDGSVVLANLHEGDVFGEIGMIRDHAATATVKAVRKTAVVMLPANEFAEVVSEPHNSQVRDYLIDLTNSRIERTRQTINDIGEVLGEDEIVVV